MEFFKTNTKINFLGVRKWAALFSAVLFVASMVSFFIHGLNLGLDFTGGTQIQLEFKQAADMPKVRQQLRAAGFDKFEVQSYGDSRNIMVTLANSRSNAKNLKNQAVKKSQDALTKDVLKAIPNAHFKMSNFIGAKVSSQLAYNGILAVVIAMIATMIYIAFRFEWRLAIGAAVALIHDPVLILGIFSFFNITFSLTALAAVLTILGYSLHDSIVVFDRVRENFRKMRRGSPVEVVNSAINQTLSRTVMSSNLTLMVVVVLFLFGGATIHDFALALIIGIIVGTYSSIYVAGSLAVSLGLTRKDLMPQAKQSFDETP